MDYKFTKLLKEAREEQNTFHSALLKYKRHLRGLKGNSSEFTKLSKMFDTAMDLADKHETKSETLNK